MKFGLGIMFAIGLFAQSLTTVEVVSKPVDRFVTLTAEILPYQTSSLAARVNGYIESIEVDRGSTVRKGQVIARLSAPEMTAQVAEVQARLLSIEAQVLESKSKLAAAESTARRLKAASLTVGAIAANELVLAEEGGKAAQASLKALELSRSPIEAQVRTLKDLESYLVLRAPFDGLITERMMHPGSLAGPTSGPLVRLEQLNRLRVVVAVPESNVSSIRMGQRIGFTVTGYPGESFGGVVSRIARTLDARTRTMAVELEAMNVGGKLAPGMYTEVKWPAKSGQTTLLVPATAVASTTERSFVIRVENGVARYVNVRKGPAQGELVEVAGALAAGDRIIQRATDEIREGTKIPAR